MKYFRYLTFSFFLIVSLWGQDACLASEDNKHDYRSLAQRCPVPFNPDDYQRLKGEAKIEEAALHYLRELEKRAKGLDVADRRTNQDFLKARDHLADNFLKLLSYSAHLKGGLGSMIAGVTHTNTLTSVVNQSHVQAAINPIYFQRPIMAHTVDQVYNEELVRPDFNPRIAIGKSPFFNPLCDLLGRLYSNQPIDIQPHLTQTLKVLEKRYIYYTYLQPLSLVLAKLDEILEEGKGLKEGIASSSYQYLLKMDEEDDEDLDDELDELDDFVSTWPKVREIPDDINDYLDSNRRITIFLKQFKDIIYHSIAYRYGLDDKDSPVYFSPAFIRLRNSVPWNELSTLGSAAQIARDNYQIDIQRMFIQAMPDLLEDLKTLKTHLAVLEEAESDRFLGLPHEMGKREFQYPHIKLLTDWYINFIGIDMVETHLREVKQYADSFESVEKTFEGMTRQQLWCVEDKLPFLQSKSRLYLLFYIFIDGELSKQFIKTLEGQVDDEWLCLFQTFKAVRDEIMHKTQEEGQESFEKRLKALDDKKWNELLKNYIDIHEILSDLEQGVDQLTWKDLKQQDWKSKLPILHEDARKKLASLRRSLRELSTFITSNSWEDPESLKEQYHILMKEFIQMLPDKQKKNFSHNLLEGETTKWSGWFNGLGKKVTQREGVEKKWTDIKSVAAKVRGITKQKKTYPSRTSGPDKLLKDLREFRWVLTELEKAYENGGVSRFSSHPEGRIGEFYLILIRDSANSILYSLSDYLVFAPSNKQTVAYFNACTYLLAAIPQLVANFGNHKAHIHRLIEKCNNELHYQTIGNMMCDKLNSLNRNADVVLSFVEQNGVTLLQFIRHSEGKL